MSKNEKQWRDQGAATLHNSLIINKKSRKSLSMSDLRLLLLVIPTGFEPVTY